MADTPHGRTPEFDEVGAALGVVLHELQQPSHNRHLIQKCIEGAIRDHDHALAAAEQRIRELETKAQAEFQRYDTAAAERDNAEELLEGAQDELKASERQIRALVLLAEEWKARGNVVGRLPSEQATAYAAALGDCADEVLSRIDKPEQPGEPEAERLARQQAEIKVEELNQEIAKLEDELEKALTTG